VKAIFKTYNGGRRALWKDVKTPAALVKKNEWKKFKIIIVIFEYDIHN
jgi:hypothetical protein